MSHLPPLNTVASDPLISTDLSIYHSPIISEFSPAMSQPSPEQLDSQVAGPSTPSEADPLLSHAKPFYRARPMWLVPFAITAALVRGMTLAPRVEVFTQLSCYRLHGHPNYNHSTTSPIASNPTLRPLYTVLDPLAPHPHPEWQSRHYDTNDSKLVLVSFSPLQGDGGYGEDEDDPRRLPSAKCVSDAEVQSGAAQLQTMMTVIMGSLSAMTTGWWGHFSERHGRNKVLAISTFGFLVTDLMFILASTPNSPLSAHGHRLLMVAPFIEGLLGGWSTLQSATSAYISDCTSSGSRAHIFSRFTGAFYLGLSVGPAIGGWLIRHDFIGAKSWTAEAGHTVTSVFWMAVLCSFLNFIQALFILPESLDKKRQQAIAQHQSDTKGKQRAVEAEEPPRSGPRTTQPNGATSNGLLRQLFKPIEVFLPVTVVRNGRQRRDWSLTLLAGALFAYMLSGGIYQLKYLYAVHVYGWTAEQLSYYISFLGGARATFLLFLLPFLISTFKPKQETSLATGPKKPPPTQSQLAQEISFDLSLTRCSLLVDILSNTLTTLVPPPAYKAHSLPADGTAQHQPDQSGKHSQAFFVMATALSSMGSGTLPAVQSLALCIVQLRALRSGNPTGGSDESTGKLLGALAVLQAIGQMVLAPMLFGLIYSETVATYPKAIFTTAAGILFLALVLVLLVQAPDVRARKGTRRTFKDVERGRSRVSKDLRGGAAQYGSINWINDIIILRPDQHLQIRHGKADEQQSHSTQQPRRRPLSVVVYVAAMNNASSNAVAGPSTPRKPSSPTLPTSNFALPDPPLFLPPPGVSQPTGYLASTQDLLQRFQLLPAYDKYVRPFAAPAETGLDQGLASTQTAHYSVAMDKGKGKEVASGGLGGTQGVGVAGVGEGEDDEGPQAGKGDKKRKNNYKHLIKGIPGKHSVKKDEYFTTLILVPPKQTVRIVPFDARTQRDAFTVSVEGLKNWNASNLILESAQAREDRKQRKEAKRLAKAQAAGGGMPVPGAPVASPQVPIQAPIPTSVSAPSVLNRPAAGTPQPNTSTATKPASSAPRSGQAVPRPGSAVQRPGSARPGSALSGRPATSTPKPTVAASNVAPSIRNTTPANGQAPSSTPQRGTKREREDSAAALGANVNGPPVVNGYTNGNAVPHHGTDGATSPIVNVRAGVPGVRPRPVKKQRVDMHGQARDMAAPIQQQPTPQGV
ncbi:hypothetical protein AX16_002703 [Volvariella volvacea WC 439]|nr:hypothetical protein AX16_002703 [Volvariella volvacea WC 439]